MKTNSKWLIRLPGILIFVVDRAFKKLFANSDQVLIPGVIKLTGTRNTGMALGLFQNSALWILLISAVLALICIWGLRKYRISGMAALGLSLIAGGALGNAIDRILYGYVIDMIEFLFVDFYIFNMADVGVVCGAVLCGFSLLFRPQDWSDK